MMDQTCSHLDNMSKHESIAKEEVGVEQEFKCCFKAALEGCSDPCDITSKAVRLDMNACLDFTPCLVDTNIKNQLENAWERNEQMSIHEYKDLYLVGTLNGQQ